MAVESFPLPLSLPMDQMDLRGTFWEEPLTNENAQHAKVRGSFSVRGVAAVVTLPTDLNDVTLMHAFTHARFSEGFD